MEKEWQEYQQTHKTDIIQFDVLNKDDIRYVGGLDISFDKSNENKGCAYLTIYDIHSQSIVYEDYYLCELTIPYISGYLGFREIPHYKHLLDKIIGTIYYPQVLLIDGSGILHQREFGSASHLGYECDIPTIGVTKTLLSHDGLSEYTVKRQFKSNCHKKGDYVSLIGNSGIIWGLALKTSNNTNTPIYVTIGHKISLNTATQIVLQCSKYKIPEPIRNSDIKSKLFFT
jgi:deoxyinosine 3'endonuclease (endonuclease V)